MARFLGRSTEYTLCFAGNFDGDRCSRSVHSNEAASLSLKLIGTRTEAAIQEEEEEEDSKVPANKRIFLSAVLRGREGGSGA